MNKRKKDHLNMTADELAAETAPFDNGAVPPGRPLTDAQRNRFEKALAGGSRRLNIGPGRPKMGEGAVAVPVSVEAGLLRRAAAKAASLKLKRSEYFAKALQLLTDGEIEIDGAKLSTAPIAAPKKNARSSVARKTGFRGNSAGKKRSIG